MGRAEASPPIAAEAGQGHGGQACFPCQLLEGPPGHAGETELAISGLAPTKELDWGQDLCPDLGEPRDPHRGIVSDTHEAFPPALVPDWLPYLPASTSPSSLPVLTFQILPFLVALFPITGSAQIRPQAAPHRTFTPLGTFTEHLPCTRRCSKGGYVAVQRLDFLTSWSTNT